MTTTPAQNLDPRIQAFGCYLVFRHADRAQLRGRLSAPALAAVNLALRTQMTAVWTRLFPGKEPAAYAWILTRSRLLEAEGVLAPSTAESLRKVAQQRMQAGAPVEETGALLTLWRLHMLYLLVLELDEVEKLPPNGVDRVREAVHMMALTTLATEVRRAGERGQTLIESVLEQARFVVRSLINDKALTEADAAVLYASLGGREAPATGGALMDAMSGSCLVCGDSLKALPVVFCAQCETPCHADCWSYAGRCSTFACGCMEAVPRAGARVSPPRFDLERPRPATRMTPPSAPTDTSAFQTLALVILGAGLIAMMLGF